MAVTSVTVHKTTRTNTPPSDDATITKQAIDAITGSGNGIDVTDFYQTSDGVLFIDNTTGSAKDITIKAGSHESCVKAGIGDKVIEIPASSLVMIDQIESARFKDDDTGSLVVEFEAGMTGYAWTTGKSRGIG